MKKITLFLALLLTSVVTTQAQKYGHLNFGTLLSVMPETDAADKELETLQKGLVAKGEEMAKAFQAKYLKAVEEVQGGGLSPLQQQQKQEELQKEQAAIGKYEQEISQQLEAKRGELLKPIVEKARKAIDEVAKAGGYLMVFDSSVFNSILFAQPADDLMPAVKAKLGIKE